MAYESCATLQTLLGLPFLLLVFQDGADDEMPCGGVFNSQAKVVAVEENFESGITASRMRIACAVPTKSSRGRMNGLASLYLSRHCPPAMTMLLPSQGRGSNHGCRQCPLPNAIGRLVDTGFRCVVLPTTLQQILLIIRRYMIISPALIRPVLCLVGPPVLNHWTSGTPHGDKRVAQKGHNNE